MTLALRRGVPDDYDVIYDGETVGRIHRMTDRERWRWMIRWWAPPPGPSGGVSATLDEAMAAFRAKWDAQGLAMDPARLGAIARPERRSGR